MAKFIIFSILFLIISAPAVVMATPSGQAVMIHKFVITIPNQNEVSAGSFSQKFDSMAACNNAKSELNATDPFPPTWAVYTVQGKQTICVPFYQ